MEVTLPDAVGEREGVDEDEDEAAAEEAIPDAEEPSVPASALVASAKGLLDVEADEAARFPSEPASAAAAPTAAEAALLEVL